jgi:hypothetical protein
MKAQNANTFRFVMAEGDRLFSSIWRIWTNDKRDQLMIAPPSKKPLSCKVNIKFGASRFCHYAITRQYKDEMSVQGLKPPPHKDEVQWFRRPTPPVGSIPLALCNIYLPYDPNYSGPRGQHSKKDLLKLSPPGIGKAWVIEIYVSFDDPSTIPIPDKYQVRTTFPLATKENVMVLTEVVDFDKTEFLRPLTGHSDGTVFHPAKDIAEVLADSPILHLRQDPRTAEDNIFRIYEFGNVKIDMTRKG